MHHEDFLTISSLSNLNWSGSVCSYCYCSRFFCSGPLAHLQTCTLYIVVHWESLVTADISTGTTTPGNVRGLSLLNFITVFIAHCFSFPCKNCSCQGNFWQTNGEETTLQIIISMKIKVLSIWGKCGLLVRLIFKQCYKYQISLVCFSRPKWIHILLIHKV